MAIILNIDTATEIAIVSLSENEKVLATAINTNQKDHASFLQPAIKNLLFQVNILIEKLNAIAVTAGPGSYSGLRVGMASAKGLCYALNIPMIAINTLEVMALSSINQNKQALYCPMIDARRMEVFTAVYDDSLKEILQPCAMIINKDSFKDLLQKHTIYFFGSGSIKLKDILQDQHAIFLNKEITPDAMACLSYKKFINNNFENIASLTPLYLKDFHTFSPSGKS